MIPFGKQFGRAARGALCSLDSFLAQGCGQYLRRAHSYAWVNHDGASGNHRQPVMRPDMQSFGRLVESSARAAASFGYRHRWRQWSLAFGVFALVIVASFVQVRRRTLPGLRDNGPLRPVPIQLVRRSAVDSDEISAHLRHFRRLMEPPDQFESASAVLHYLDYWSADESLAGDGRLLSDFLVSVLFDGRYGSPSADRRSLFYLAQDGIVRTRLGSQEHGEAHVGQVVAVLGMNGIEINAHLSGPSHELVLRDAVKGIIADFELAGELEWSALALLYYLPPARTWTNRWGEEFSFDRVARELLAREMRDGSCHGTHKFYVFAMLLGLDIDYDLLSPVTLEAVRRRVFEACDYLSASQLADGGWSPMWTHTSGGVHPVDDAPLSERLHVTGHVLEWLAQLPDDVRPRGRMMHTAAQWSLRVLDQADQQEVRRKICHFEHAMRALLPSRHLYADKHR
jgi:hypothetical protein